MTLSQADLNQPSHFVDDCSNTLSTYESSRRTSDSSSVSGPSTDSEALPLTDWSRQAYKQAHRTSRKSRYTIWTETIWRARVSSWLQGPIPPHKSVIKSSFPRLNANLQAIQTVWLPGKLSSVAGVVTLIIWFFAFSKILSGSTSTTDQNPVHLACHDRLWPNASFCGLHGRNCEPFVQNSFVFICPSDCASVHVLEPHIVGNQEILYNTMVVGGAGHVYRGDSFICQAAIHAGLFSNSRGGCGHLERSGEQGRFPASLRNTISSIEFLPTFPLTYTLSATAGSCTDPQWKLFSLSLATTIWLSILDVSTQAFLVSTLIVVFFQVALASDRPLYSDQARMLSMAFERFLPTTFVVYAVCQFCIHHTLHGLQGRLEKTLFWLGGCWVGALNNYTFDRLPISRLTVHDIRQQPGAFTTLLILIIIVSIAAIGQVEGLRAEGKLLKFLGVYLGFGTCLTCLIMFPNLQLRLHHYIIALLLLPGTCLRTRRSLLYQGLLFGLLVNGIARWGYASILQTAEALREDGILGSAVPQIIRRNLLDVSHLSFTISQSAKGFDGLSVLVNDVERYRESGSQTSFVFNWTRGANEVLHSFDLVLSTPCRWEVFCMETTQTLQSGILTGRGVVRTEALACSGRFQGNFPRMFNAADCANHSNTADKSILPPR